MQTKLLYRFSILFWAFLVFTLQPVFGQKETSLDKLNEVVEITEFLPVDTILKKKGGLVPVPYPITDPNLGYGGILGVAYMHENKNSDRPNTPQTISGIAGGATSTGTWMISVFHSQSIKDDQMRYNGMIGYADIFINYYLLKEIEVINFPINTNLKFWGTQHEMLFRIGQSNFFIGPQYRYLNLKGKIKLEANHPDYDDLVVFKDFKEIVSAVALLGNFDSRDNVLSPLKGYYTGFMFRKNATWLGASRDYIWGQVYGYAYYKLSRSLFTILHANYDFTDDNSPFYSKPYIGLRGVPVMRYQGNHAISAEVQLRYAFYKNLSVVGFTGMGKAFRSYDKFNDREWIYNYGTGFRYNIKKLDNLRVGFDLGWSQSDFTWGIVLGTGL